MQDDDIVRMANQIAQFFSAYPEEDAVEGVRDHMVKFWPPSMRKDLLVVANGLVPSETTLHPLVLKAAAQLRPSGQDDS
ncbi:formate dehydrogenase subunit delta [Gemmatimonas sp.]